MLARVAAAWMVVVFTALVLAFTPHRMDQVYGYMRRYRIKPGITGWAQVNGYRGATAKVEKMEARVKFDLFYIRNWTF
jgi:lipopolysaccharide/colanic/teichoic acid biosynthesis glycosyltransferase